MKHRQSIYCIGGDEGPIKIGISNDPGLRMTALQTSSPYKLKLLAQIPGDREMEFLYHSMFAAHRMQGEWFARVAPILEEISRINMIWSGEITSKPPLPAVIAARPEWRGVTDFDGKILAYTIKEASKSVGIGQTKLFELIKTGRLKSTRIGRRRLIPAEALRELLVGGAA